MRNQCTCTYYQDYPCDHCLYIGGDVNLPDLATMNLLFDIEEKLINYALRKNIIDKNNECYVEFSNRSYDEYSSCIDNINDLVNLFSNA